MKIYLISILLGLIQFGFSQETDLINNPKAKEEIQAYRNRSDNEVLIFSMEESRIYSILNDFHNIAFNISIQSKEEAFKNLTWGKFKLISRNKPMSFDDLKTHIHSKKGKILDSLNGRLGKSIEEVFQAKERTIDENLLKAVIIFENQFMSFSRGIDKVLKFLNCGVNTDMSIPPANINPKIWQSINPDESFCREEGNIEGAIKLLEAFKKGILLHPEIKDSNYDERTMVMLISSLYLFAGQEKVTWYGYGVQILYDLITES